VILRSKRTAEAANAGRSSARRSPAVTPCHVAACAVAGDASLIVTSNVRDFNHLPDGIVAVTPDDFLLRLMSETPHLLRTARDAQSARLQRKPMDVAAILELLRLVAPKFVSAWSAAG
jgi:hypothetical protein